jgi:hypothetical protein
MVVTLQELVLALLDRVCEAACAPAFLVHYVCFAVGDESLDPLPGLRGFAGADHGAKYNH